MKKILFSMLATAAAAAFSSCEDQLDIEQKGVIVQENFYKTDADAQKALANAYEKFMVETMGRTSLGPGIYTPGRVLANHPADDVNYGGTSYGDHEFGGSIDEFRYFHTPEAIVCHYKGLYFSIYACNLILDGFKEPSTDFQKQAVAEARVLRAYDYFLLASYWGQPPFVDHVLSPEEKPSNSEMTQQEYFVWVAKECEAAVNDLIERESTDDKNGAVRVTKGFANALAGKAYMFAKDYKSAQTALEKVINSGKYDLVPGSEYANLFHVEGDGCAEKVFEINEEYSSVPGEWNFGSGWGYANRSTWMESQCFQWRNAHFKAAPHASYCGVEGWGSIGVPQWFGDEFFENDGKSDRFRATLAHIDDVIYHNTGIEGMDYGNEKLNTMSVDDLKKSKDVGINNKKVGLYDQSFWLPVKHLVRAADTMNDNAESYGSNRRLNNIIVMRYAEVLLMYAECCIQNGDNGTAKTYINKIQERAGSKTISTSVDMEVLKKEKEYELWFEGCRFQDILRWQDATAIARLEKKGTDVSHLFDKLFRDPDDDKYKDESKGLVWENGTKANSRFYLTYTQEAKDAGFEVGFKKGKHELFPYPITVLDANPNLKQNPGY